MTKNILCNFLEHDFKEEKMSSDVAILQFLGNAKEHNCPL